MTASLRPGREYSLQGDDKGHHQERLQVVMRETAATQVYGLRIHERIGVRIRQPLLRHVGAGPDMRSRVGLGAKTSARHRGVGVGGEFRLEQCDGLRAALLSQKPLGQPGSVTRMHWCASLKIGERKSALAVATISGAKQREERRVLANRQYLSVTKGPAL